jgi:methylase of polypeptide subunit release factors
MPRPDDLEGIDLLRAALERGSYTTERIRETLDLEGPFSRDPHDAPVYLRLLPDDEFGTLARLFLLGLPVDAAAARAALAPLALERLEAMGVLVPTDAGGVEATVDLLPWNGLWVASDPLAVDLPPTREDHVIGVHPPTVTLAELTVRRRVEATLDVGTGSGVEALLASAHSGRVVGTDVNPRALDFARFNARLNRVENADFRLGDLFEPVAGERFGLIVCNPPYVISPESAYAFRDGRGSADAFCEELVRRSAEHLAEGGFAILLVGWVHDRDEAWSTPVRRWVDGSGCDAIALHVTSQDPLAYAASWNRPLRWDRIAYEQAIERWLEHDARLGIEAKAWGAVVLRRRAGRNWFAGHTVGLGRMDAAGHQVERMFATHDYLEGLDGGRSLLSARVVLAPDHRIDQTLALEDGERVVERAGLRLAGGFNFQLELNENALELVSRLDGRPLESVLREMSDGASDAARRELVDTAVPMVRALLALGFAVPVEEAR